MMAEMEDYYVQHFFLLLLSTIVVGAILIRKQHNKVHPRPPSPLALPIIGHLHLISNLPHQSFHKLSMRYGPIIQIFLGSIPCVVISSPHIVKELFKTHEANFSDRFQNIAVTYLSYGLKGFLFASYGSYWKFVKKLCMSELLGSRTLDQFISVRQQETLRFLRLLQQKGEASEAVNVGDELLTLTNSVISIMTIRKTCCESDGDVEDIRKMVTDTSNLAGKFNVSDFIWFCKNLDLQGMNKRLKEIHERFDTMMEKVIREHEEKRKKMMETGENNAHIKDLLDILLEIHEDEKAEMKISKENIKAFILDLFMAGTDTSSITIEWALSELINHPHIMEKARQEIESVTKKCRLIQESDIPNLPYLQAIVKETLRIHPTVPLFGRMSSESDNVCGYEIPAKCYLVVNLWSMGRDPKLWDNPLEFKPERFIGEENKFDMRGQNFQLMPFGSGRRLCPGTSLALQVVPTNLAAMIQCFDWKVHETLDMKEKPSITLPRAHPLVSIPVPRFDTIPSIV